MEIWAIVVLVVGTNLGTALIALLGNKKQLENADKRLEKQLKAQREENQHERSWIVRSQPLLKLREEIAAMAEKLESSIDLAIQLSNEATPEADKIRESLGKAVEEWDRYFESGELIKTLHMQYKHGIKLEGEKIMLDYQSAYTSIRSFHGSKKVGEAIGSAKELVKRNAVKFSEIQEEINKLLEEL